MGSFMMDVVIRVGRRPGVGETVVGESFAMSLGGKGFNQAVAAARAGAATAMVGRLGEDDFGREFFDFMASENIDSSCVEIDSIDGTGVGAPLVDAAGDNSIVIVPRANSNLTAAGVDQAAELIAGADVLLLQLEVPIDAVVRAAEHAHRAGTTVVLNPAPAVVGLERFAGLVDVLVPNHGEACLLAGVEETTDPLVAASALRDACGAAVIVTLGADGVVILDGEGVEQLEAHAVEVVDTVGAGDAFCGTLGARLAAGDGLWAASVYANAAGGAAVTKAGAGPALPAWADVEALLDRA